jgi:hypothetical protein
MTTYERVAYRTADNKPRRVLLADPVETHASFAGVDVVLLSGVEVDSEGSPVYGKGFDERRHLIATDAIRARVPMVMNMTYGWLEPAT